MNSVQVIPKAAWASLAASLAIFVIGLWLLRSFLCQSYGPHAFAVSLIFCAAAALLFFISAFQRRSIRVAGGALAVALLGGTMLLASIGLAVPGCSGA
jgi:peptidoglycan/LPS O-acetylase OafA/YrhL